jgi:hypothetical protein
VYYATGNTFPNSKELTGRIVGIAEHQGDAMTWLVLDDVLKYRPCRYQNDTLTVSNPQPS